jgi:hypothetical protein
MRTSPRWSTAWAILVDKMVITEDSAIYSRYDAGWLDLREPDVLEDFFIYPDNSGRVTLKFWSS